MASPLWNIQFGDYDLSIDRGVLTLTLTETKTGTVWGTDVSLGWIEVENRENGDVTRHDFGSLRQVSVSEKAGPQGKRILFGLDLNGLPLDVYMICAQREIQMVVEASRDTKTHRVHGFGLVPGLCSVPEGRGNYLLWPTIEGAYLKSFAPKPPQRLGYGQTRWDVWADLALPLTGAVREDGEDHTSALGLFTDSAYALLREDEDSFSWEYERDPERRRLDLRILVFPNGDAISIARAYREKQIATNNHITLRRKMRENPTLEQILGRALIMPDGEGADAEALAAQLEKGYSVSCVIAGQSDAPVFSRVRAEGLDNLAEAQTKWDTMDLRLQTAKGFHDAGELVQTTKPMDWSAIAVDMWPSDLGWGRPMAPLNAVIYRDSVVAQTTFYPGCPYPVILRAFLSMAFPVLSVSQSSYPASDFGPACAVLCPLYKLTFASFLTSHRFLTLDYRVEEAVYSDKTRIVINQSETDIYEDSDLSLPPLGFYIRHAQMEAHDALRVGQETFPTRKYRIARADDGKPLETSESVSRQEFDTPNYDTRNKTGKNPLS